MREISRITDSWQVHVDSRRMDRGQPSRRWQRIERRPQSREAEGVIHPRRKTERRERVRQRGRQASEALVLLDTSVTEAAHVNQAQTLQQGMTLVGGCKWLQFVGGGGGA